MKTVLSLSIVLVTTCVLLVGCEPAQKPKPAPATTSSQAAVVYACPMHPEVVSNDPNARCPKCGMKLEKKTQ